MKKIKIVEEPLGVEFEFINKPLSDDEKAAFSKFLKELKSKKSTYSRPKGRKKTTTLRQN
jgi:hypothetical protein